MRVWVLRVDYVGSYDVGVLPNGVCDIVYWLLLLSGYLILFAFDWWDCLITVRALLVWCGCFDDVCVTLFDFVLFSILRCLLYIWDFVCLAMRLFVL